MYGYYNQISGQTWCYFQMDCFDCCEQMCLKSRNSYGRKNINVCSLEFPTRSRVEETNILFSLATRFETTTDNNTFDIFKNIAFVKVRMREKCIFHT